MPTKPPTFRPAWLPKPKPRQPTPNDKQRGSAHQRGYDKTWQKFREMVLNERPLCVDCKALGSLVPALELHHLIRVREQPELRLEPTNVIGLCKACHSRRTAKGE